MLYKIRVPDITQHDHKNCAGGNNCEAYATREGWDRTHPVWRQAGTEVECARVFRVRFPDALPVPMRTKIADEEVCVLMFIADEETAKRFEVTRQQMALAAVIEAVPETREDRKDIKKSRVWDQKLWHTGYVPELAETLLERQVVMRSHLRVGAVTLPLHVGVNSKGDFELQVPGTVSFVLPAELMEAIGNLPSSVKR